VGAREGARIDPVEAAALEVPAGLSVAQKVDVHGGGRGERSGVDRPPPQISLLLENFGDRDCHRDRGADHGVVAHADQAHHLDVGRHR